MSDTPRTDARVRRLIENDHAPDQLEHFARDLERELATVTGNALALSQSNAELRSRIRRLEEAAREVYLDSIASDHQWSTLEASHMNALRKVLEAKP